MTLYHAYDGKMKSSTITECQHRQQSGSTFPLAVLLYVREFCCYGSFFFFVLILWVFFLYFGGGSFTK